MKKILVGAFLGIFTVAGIAILPNYTDASDRFKSTKGFTDGGGFNSQDVQYNVDVAGAKDMQEDSLIRVIKTAINWVLGILALIALCLCLWGGFQMMISGGDEGKYGNGINLLKWAAIGLAVIALSWLIVSIIFYVIQGSTEGAELDSETSNASAQGTRQTYQGTKQPYQGNGRSADVKH